MSLILLPHGNVILSYSALYVVSTVLETSPDVCTGRMKRSSNCIPYSDINPINVNRIGLNNRSIATDYPLSTELFFRYVNPHVFLSILDLATHRVLQMLHSGRKNEAREIIPLASGKRMAISRRLIRHSLHSRFCRDQTYCI